MLCAAESVKEPLGDVGHVEADDSVRGGVDRRVAVLAAHPDGRRAYRAAESHGVGRLLADLEAGVSAVEVLGSLQDLHWRNGCHRYVPHAEHGLR